MSCNCGCGDKHGHHGGSCGCHQNAQFGRWLWTKAEKIAWLEEQLANLQEEVKAYEERIAALKAE
jgi:hypothetical protein